MSVEVTKIERIRNPRGEYWMRFTGAVDGVRVRDTLEMPIANYDALGHAAALEKIKKQFEGLQRWFHEQDTATD